jgi:hypothetical protein
MWYSLEPARIPLLNVMRNQKQRGRAGLPVNGSVYRAVLAVKDEGGDALAADAVFDP